MFAYMEVLEPLVLMMPSTNNEALHSQYQNKREDNGLYGNYLQKTMRTGDVVSISNIRTT